MNNYFDISIFGIALHVNVTFHTAFIAYWKNWWKEIKAFSDDEDKKEQKDNEQKTEKV